MIGAASDFLSSSEMKILMWLWGLYVIMLWKEMPYNWVNLPRSLLAQLLWMAFSVPHTQKCLFGCTHKNGSPKNADCWFTKSIHNLHNLLSGIFTLCCCLFLSFPSSFPFDSLLFLNSFDGSPWDKATTTIMADYETSSPDEDTSEDFEVITSSI